jgi:SAM-dependent methyltransferase
MNEYSNTWFELFMDTIDPAQTAREVAFLARQLPLPTFTRVLDVCCGTGRHAALLAERGYDVTGIDVNGRAISQAQKLMKRSHERFMTSNGRLALLNHDMRDIARLRGEFDAVLLLWQGFGQFDDATNGNVLRQIAGRIVPGGRFVLDVYHRGFFETRPGTRVHERLGRTITERKHMAGPRLVVELDYGDGGGDRFAWRVFTPEEMVELADSVGLRDVVQCAEFDENVPPSTDRPGMQFVFER